MNIPRLVALGLIALTSLGNAKKTEELSLTRIQKLLIAKRMVDLTHGTGWRICGDAHRLGETMAGRES